jgi:hypothetical protein
MDNSSREDKMYSESSNSPAWLHQLTQRRFVLVSGVLALLVGSNILRVAQGMIPGPSGQALIADPLITQAFFFVLLVYAFIWIAGSVVGLRALSRQPVLRESIRAQWWNTPIVLQVIVFGEHWVLATFYVFLTGDAGRGAALGLISLLHILVVLIVGPMITNQSVV